MSYVDSLLAPGERVVRRGRQHWFVLVWNARWAILSLVAASALILLRAASPDSNVVLTLLSWVTLALFVLGIASIARGWLRYQGAEYLVTTRRVIHAAGVVNKRVTDSALEGITDARLTETAVGRLLGFGDLEVLTASGAGVERLRMLAGARSFKAAMAEARHDRDVELARPLVGAARPPEAPTRGPGAPGGLGGPGTRRLTADEVADELDRLADERSRGVITPDEFLARRRELLGRM